MTSVAEMVMSWGGNFDAAHSSTALAVNCFAWFKPGDRLPFLHLLDAGEARSLSFERKFRIFNGGRAPNLDVWVEHDRGEIAIESKLTEYFVKKQPKFSQAYDRLAPPRLAEPCWWQVYEQAKRSEPGYLDIAQLVKHYFGLRKYQQTEARNRLILLYLYWEPLNWSDFRPCRQHMKELEQLIAAIRDSEISFQAMTYNQLWNAWSDTLGLVQHVRNLKNRYEVRL